MAKFKVGDKVKVIKETGYYTNEDYTGEGEVVKMYEEHAVGLKIEGIADDTSSNEWSFLVEDLELITDK